MAAYACFGTPNQESPFGSNPSPFGGNVSGTAFGLNNTNSSNAGSFGVQSPFARYPSPFDGNGTLCYTNLGTCQTSNNLNGGSSTASYRATNESDSSTAMMQSISTMNVYANKSHEELRHEDYQMNNKGRPKPINGSFGSPTSMSGLHQSSEKGIFGLPARNPFDLLTVDQITPNTFSPSFTNSPFDPPKPNNPFPALPVNCYTTMPTPSNAFCGAGSTYPFSSNLPLFPPPKPISPLSVPSPYLFTPQTQRFSFPPNTTPNSSYIRAPSTNFDTVPTSVPPPAGNINWGAFATFVQQQPQNNAEAKIATPTAPCKCCSIPETTSGPCAPNLNASKPDVLSTTNSRQPSQGEATQDKARASFRVNVSCIDIDDVGSIMPKLPPGEEYYTVPPIEELEAKERAEPGFCSRVKDFVVGRKDKGSIKFLGETDVRELDLESIVQFNDREVVVYLDETKMPPVGQGLNKPAEVTLLNVKCISKLTGKLYNDGPQLRMYEEKLMEKSAEIGGEFVSYDPVRGQWKFMVLHF